MFATFGGLDAKGIWTSTDKGVSWTNIGFSQDVDTTTLYGNRIKFGSQGLPFILAVNTSLENSGLFCYGAEDVFVGIDETRGMDQDFMLFPNPLTEGSFYIKSSSKSSID